MGRPRRRPDETATNDRLLSAATAEFARRGLDGARLQDIAGAAGITRPSLLYHFPSKQDLYAAVLGGVFAALGELLTSGIVVEGSFSERFDDVIRRLGLFFAERPEVATLVLRVIIDAEGPGQALLLEAGVPLLKRMERFVREEGRGVVRTDVPVRAALMQVFSSVLVRTAAGPLREPVWGKTDKTRALAHILFLKE